MPGEKERKKTLPRDKTRLRDDPDVQITRQRFKIITIDMLISTVERQKDAWIDEVEIKESKRNARNEEEKILKIKNVTEGSSLDSTQPGKKSGNLKVS